MARENDEQIDRLLRQVLKADAATTPVEDCPDAEVLAAWADGRLTGPMQSAAVSHLSACARCQAIVGELARIEPPSERGTWWRHGVRLRWLVPATAVAAAVVIWLVVPSTPPSIDQVATQQTPQAENEPPASVSQPSSDVRPASPAQSVPALEPPAERQRAQVPPTAALESPTAAPSVRDERADFAAGRAAPTQADADAAIGGVAAKKEMPDARAAALPQRAPVAATAVARPLTVASPDRSVNWRIEVNGAIARSSDGGSTWDTVADGLGVNVLAGGSPSPEVCWLVGRGGTVLLAIDGRRFTRLPFPDNGDLVAVQATDGRTAQVTASGGRIFRTTDGGQTWVESRPQDF
jgi:hypothetical protein